MPLTADSAVSALRRRGAGRWGVPAAAFVAVAMAVSVSAALTISRIDHGTAVDVARPTATSAYAASSGAPGR